MNNTRGFTLIELLMVIAIIGILANVILPSVQTARDKARVAKAKVELNQIDTAMRLLHEDTGNYPNGESAVCPPADDAGNEIDVNDPNAGLSANGQSWSGWEGPYMDVEEDPWGTPYYLDTDYQCLAETEGCDGLADAGQDSSVLVSCGPDQAEDGGAACVYDDDNIVLLLCRL